jgi:hypothetical protein
VTLHQKCISIEIIIGEKRYSLWYQHKKNKCSLSNYTWWSCSFFISAVITGVQMGEMSKLGWLIGWPSREMWADSLYFLHVLFGSICKTFASFQHILWPSSYACWANFDFSSKTLCQVIFVLLNAYFLKVCLFHRCNICHSYMWCFTHTASSAGYL